MWCYSISVTSARDGHCSLPVGVMTMTLSLCRVRVTAQYRALTPLYYHEAAVAVVVYDITNRSSFAAVPVGLPLIQFAAAPAAVRVGAYA